MDSHSTTEEGQKRAIPSDLDSVSAQQVDEKFKEIMRKKKGNIK